MEPDAYVTLTQATKLVEASKTSIHRAIKSGKLPIKSKDTSGYRIDRSDLFNHFPAKPQFGTDVTDKEHSVTSNETLELQYKIREMEMQVTYLKETMQLKDEMLNEARQNAEKWQSMAENNQLLLNHSQEELQRSTEKPVQRQKRFLGIIPYQTA